MTTKKTQNTGWENNTFNKDVNSDHRYKLALLLALLVAMPTVEANKTTNSAPVVTQTAPDESELFNAYVNSKYQYDDAALLAKLWGISVVEAKHAIGRKVINQIEDLLPAEVQALQKKRLNNKKNNNNDALFAAYANSNYQYDDAALLAKLWNIPVLEAKHTIGYKITNQIEDLLPAEVRDLHKKRKKDKKDNADAMYTTYINSNYQYEDAELLAKLWKVSILEAKQTIGYKITHQIEHFLPEEVQEQHKKRLNGKKNNVNAMFTTYVNSNYQYEDAELLAKIWNMSIMEAKQTIGRKITHQMEDSLPEEVQALYKKRQNAG